MKKLLCFLLGHVFGGYIPPLDSKGKPEQRFPDAYWCDRCLTIRNAKEPCQ